MENADKIIDGKAVAQAVKETLKKEAELLRQRGITPGLTVVIVGNDPASQTYVASKEKQAKELGFNSEVIRLPEDTAEKSVLDTIAKLNVDKSVHGILVQLPAPKHISEEKIIEAIAQEKDVDGFHPMNVGYLVAGNPKGFVSCTPAGVIEILEQEEIALEGKEVVIIGRSHMVGKPLIPLFIQKNSTVTVCHSKTKNLPDVTKRADILVVAIGKCKFVNKNFIKKDAVVIDVGINRLDGKLYGDVDYDDVLPFVSKITPVPGGVGPMTIAMLLSNTIKACKLQNGIV